MQSPIWLVPYASARVEKAFFALAVEERSNTSGLKSRLESDVCGKFLSDTCDVA